MALLIVEFYEDAPFMASRNESVIYGKLISSTEDTSLSTTAEHVSVPDNAQYCAVSTDTACYIEIGSGNQDVASGRRTYIAADQRLDFAVKPTDTVSYRSVS